MKTHNLATEFTPEFVYPSAEQSVERFTTKRKWFGKRRKWPDWMHWWVTLQQGDPKTTPYYKGVSVIEVDKDGLRIKHVVRDAYGKEHPYRNIWNEYFPKAKTEPDIEPREPRSPQPSPELPPEPTRERPGAA